MKRSPRPAPNVSHGRPDDGRAFLPDPSEHAGPVRAPEDLAELLAEDFVTSATTGEPVREATRNGLLEEELGGPFLEVPAGRELALDDGATVEAGAGVEDDNAMVIDDGTAQADERRPD